MRLNRYQETLALEIVKRALVLGWKPESDNKRRKVLFRFRGNGKFEVAWYGCTPAFTVNNQTSTFETSARKWLEELGPQTANAYAVQHFSVSPFG